MATGVNHRGSDKKSTHALIGRGLLFPLRPRGACEQI